MPWSNEVIIATQVIIQGTNDGLFVYDGPPANGNLIATISAHGGTDPYGNVYRAGVYVGSNLGGFLEMINGVIDFFPVGIGTLTPPQITANNPGILVLSSGTATLGDVAGGIQLLSAVGSGFSKGALVTPFVDAVDPASPGTPETYHALAMVNGWANSGGGLASLQYTLLPTNEVHLIGAITSAASTGTQFATLPANYRPAIGQDMQVTFHTTTGNTQAAFMRVGTTGACSILNSTAATGVVCINSVIPLTPST